MAPPPPPPPPAPPPALPPPQLPRPPRPTATPRPPAHAPPGNDGDQRVSTLSGRTSCTRSVSADGVPARWAQIASASNVHGTKAPTSNGRLRWTPGRLTPPSW